MKHGVEKVVGMSFVGAFLSLTLLSGERGVVYLFLEGYSEGRSHLHRKRVICGDFINLKARRLSLSRRKYMYIFLLYYVSQKKVPFNLCMLQFNVSCVASEEKISRVCSASFMLPLFMFDAAALDDGRSFSVPNSKKLMKPHPCL